MERKKHAEKWAEVEAKNQQIWDEHKLKENNNKNFLKVVKQQEKDKLQTEKELFLKNKSKQNEKFSKTRQDNMTKEINSHVARTSETLE